MCFKRKSTIKVPNHFFPGIYSFPFAFIGGVNDVGICEVELHVSENLSANTPYLVTAIIRSWEKTSPAVRNFIEEICTKIRWSYFDKIISENLSANIMIEDSRIRWIEIIPFAQGKDAINQVFMEWDTKSKKYHSPQWKNIDSSF